MAWAVRLQDERGTPVVPYDAGIEFSMIPAGADFRLLRYVDPYGDTYFNQRQMADFLVDWNALKPTDDQREQWILVRDMAVKCQQEPHLYLRFIGD